MSKGAEAILPLKRSNNDWLVEPNLYGEQYFPAASDRGRLSDYVALAELIGRYSKASENEKANVLIEGAGSHIIQVAEWSIAEAFKTHGEIADEIFASAKLMNSVPGRLACDREFSERGRSGWVEGEERKKLLTGIFSSNPDEAEKATIGMYLLWVESRPSGELSALKGPVEVLLRNLRVDGYLRGSAARTLVKCLDSDRASALRIILGVCKEEEGLAVRMWGALELLRDMPGWGEAMNDLIARQKNDNARAILTTLRDKSQSAPAVVSPGR